MSRLAHALRYQFTSEGQAACQALRAKDNERAKRYMAGRRASDPAFRLLSNLRARLRAAMVAQDMRKERRTMSLIGCSIPSLMQHIESLFTEGMTWSNYGAWHIDHIRPCAMFDLTDLREQRACFNWTNLQPLWAVDNHRKSDKAC